MSGVSKLAARAARRTPPAAQATDAASAPDKRVAVTTADLAFLSRASVFGFDVLSQPTRGYAAAMGVVLFDEDFACLEAWRSEKALARLDALHRSATGAATGPFSRLAVCVLSVVGHLMDAEPDRVRRAADLASLMVALRDAHKGRLV